MRKMPRATPRMHHPRLGQFCARRHRQRSWMKMPWVFSRRNERRCEEHFWSCFSYPGEVTGNVAGLLIPGLLPLGKFFVQAHGRKRRLQQTGTCSAILKVSVLGHYCETFHAHRGGMELADLLSRRVLHSCILHWFLSRHRKNSLDDILNRQSIHRTCFDAKTVPSRSTNHFNPSTAPHPPAATSSAQSSNNA